MRTRGRTRTLSRVHRSQEHGAALIGVLFLMVALAAITTVLSIALLSEGAAMVKFRTHNNVQNTETNAVLTAANTLPSLLDDTSTSSFQEYRCDPDTAGNPTQLQRLDDMYLGDGVTGAVWCVNTIDATDLAVSVYVRTTAVFDDTASSVHVLTGTITVDDTRTGKTSFDVTPLDSYTVWTENLTLNSNGVPGNVSATSCDGDGCSKTVLTTRATQDDTAYANYLTALNLCASAAVTCLSPGAGTYDISSGGPGLNIVVNRSPDATLTVDGVAASGSTWIFVSRGPVTVSGTFTGRVLSAKSCTITGTVTGSVLCPTVTVDGVIKQGYPGTGLRELTQNIASATRTFTWTVPDTYPQN